MSRLHELDYHGLRAVEQAMLADRKLRAVKTFTQYEVDIETGLVKAEDDGTMYLAQQAQKKPTRLTYPLARLHLHGRADPHHQP